jgi:uncharacterized protein (TIGR02145 family)
MKETGTTHWQSPNTGATNESGFSALPGGYRRYDGEVNSIGYAAYFWSSSEANTNYAGYRGPYYDNSDLYRYDAVKRNGYSIRLVRD